jgi:Tol biopolymer transport system component
VKKIVDTPGPERNPHWSPDGSKSPSNGGRVQVFFYTNVKIAVVDADGGTPR